MSTISRSPAEVLPVLADHLATGRPVLNSLEADPNTEMTDTQRTAELIPFDSVHRLVQERRQRRAAMADSDVGSLTAARTSQVRRLLTEQRQRTSGPEVA